MTLQGALHIGRASGPSAMTHLMRTTRPTFLIGACRHFDERFLSTLGNKIGMDLLADTPAAWQASLPVVAKKGIGATRVEMIAAYAWLASQAAIVPVAHQFSIRPSDTTQLTRRLILDVIWHKLDEPGAGCQNLRDRVPRIFSCCSSISATTAGCSLRPRHSRTAANRALPE